MPGDGPFKVLVIGATGPLGRQIVAEATRAGHRVRALARNPSTASFDGAEVVRGDVMDRASLERAADGQDAAICSLGSKLTLRPMTLLSEGTKNLIDALTARGVRRLLCVTGIGAGDSKGHGGFVYDWIIQPLILREIYRDKTRQEQLVRASGLDWTIVRPAMLTEGPARGPGAYRVASDLTGFVATKIARADVAGFLVGELSHPRHLREAVVLSD